MIRRAPSTAPRPPEASIVGTIEASDLAGNFYFGADHGTIQSVRSAVISALVSRPLQGRLIKWTSHRIRGGLMDLKDDLPFLVGDLRETEPTATVVAAVLEPSQAGTHAQRSAIVFGGDVSGVRNVDPQLVSEGQARREPASTKKLDIDRRDTLWPVRVMLKA